MNHEPTTKNQEHSDDVLVRVDNVSKRFCRSLKKSLWYGLQDMGRELTGRRHNDNATLAPSPNEKRKTKHEER